MRYGFDRLRKSISSGLAFFLALTFLFGFSGSSGFTVYADKEEGQTAYYLQPVLSEKRAADCTDTDNIQLYDCDENRSQRFVIHSEDDGSVWFEDELTGQAVTVSGDTPKAGARLILGPYQNKDSQLFDISAYSDEIYLIFCKTDHGLCISVKDAKDVNGAGFTADKVTKGTEQQFRIKTEVIQKDPLGNDGSAGYCIVPSHQGGSAIDNPYSSGNLYIFWIHRKKNQVWQLSRADGESYYIVSYYDGKVMEIDGGGKAGQRVKMSDKSSGNSKQLWKLEDAGDGNYYIRSAANNDLVLDVEGQGTADGTYICLWTQNYGPNQRFHFVEVLNPVPESEWGSERQDCSGSD